MEDPSKIGTMIDVFELELIELDARRAEIKERLDALKREREQLGRKTATAIAGSPNAGKDLDPHEKIALYRTLFRGRRNVFPKRCENEKTGRGDYRPCRRSETTRDERETPETSRADRGTRGCLPVTDTVIKSHLLGYDLTRETGEEFAIGVYMVTRDETCRLLVAEFEGEAWKEDAAAYQETCRDLAMPASLERTRTGNGRVWIFLQEPAPAGMVGKLGAHLISETLRRRPSLQTDAAARLLPGRAGEWKDRFGAYVALPLQPKAREKGNSVFLDDQNRPHEDQWAYLAAIQRAPPSRIEKIAALAESEKESEL